MCFSTDVVPYVQRCLHKVYEPASIAAFIGVTTTSLQKEVFNNIGIGLQVTVFVLLFGERSFVIKQCYLKLTFY